MHRSGVAMAWNVFRFCTARRGLGSVMILLVLAIVGVTYYAVVVANYGPALLAGSGKTIQALSQDYPITLSPEGTLQDQSSYRTWIRVVVRIRLTCTLSNRPETTRINHQSLRHSNIIRLKEVVLAPTHLVIVMEFAAGGVLFERICNN